MIIFKKRNAYVSPYIRINFLSPNGHIPAFSVIGKVGMKHAYELSDWILTHFISIIKSDTHGAN